MFKSKLFKRIALLGGIAVIAGLSVGLYVFFKPHRNVQKEKAFATISAKELTKAYTTDAKKANELYLSADGNSKVLVVTGVISKISTNQAGEQVVLLMDDGEHVGVQATFLKTEESTISKLKTGDQVAIKGAITAGNSYDADFDLYEHAILTKAALVENTNQ
jgi:tRNA(Ile2) C34 agmatinyltransferase TiaS